MHILIAGASGFIGLHLVRHWLGKHQLSAIGRNKKKLRHCFSDEVTCFQWDELNQINAKDIDVVINLSGYNIGAHRWSDEIKHKIIESRVETTKSLINWMNQNDAKPHFYCANAVGIYGLQDKPTNASKTEDSQIEDDNPPDFLTKVGVLWKQAAEKALEQDIPLTITCFGVVLEKGEGMLKKLAPSFYLGLGSIIGDGEQIISWVHIQDVVQSFDFLIQHPDITSVINLCAPTPVSQRTFAKSLAKAMKRPLFLKTPAFLIKALFGEMGECLIIKGQSVLPKRLMALDYRFKYPTINEALNAEFQKS